MLLHPTTKLNQFIQQQLLQQMQAQIPQPKILQSMLMMLVELMMILELAQEPALAQELALALALAQEPALNSCHLLKKI